MSGSLAHSPAEIIGQLLIDLAIGTDSQSADWSVFIQSEPNDPDECITVYDTANVIQGRVQPTGETQEQHGIQIRVRAGTFPTGWAIANSICRKLDTEVNQDTVTIGATSYNVHSVDRTSGPFPLGKESPQSKRELFTINATASIRQIP
jgi:hypothetical protein